VTHTKYLLGIDIGATAVKVGVFTPRGEMVGLGRTFCAVEAPHSGWAEVDVENWRQAVVDGLKSATAQAGISPQEIASVGLSNMIASIVPLDAKGQPLRKAILFFDQRSVSQAVSICERISEERVVQMMGNRVVPGNISATNMRWIVENEPHVYARTRVFALASTFICRWLAGDAVIDRTNAPYTGFFDYRNSRWAPEAFEWWGIDPAKLPPVGSSTWTGWVTAAAAAVTGLQEGTPVAIGAIDGAATSLAVGALEPDEVFESCGTSDMVSFTCKEPLIIPEFTNRPHVVPGRWACNGVMSTPGAALQWFRDQLYLQSSGRTQESAYEAMSREAEGSPPGANGLIFLPYMMGERSPIWDPHARGVFFGLSLSTTRADMVRAILEGAAYGLRQMFDIAESRLGRRYDRVIAVGGGAQNRLWTQIKADVWGKTILTPRLQEGACLGAAMMGGVATGIYKDWQAAVDMAAVKDAQETHPRDELYAVYTRYYQVYTGLYPDLAARYAQLWSAEQQGYTPHSVIGDQEARNAK
jgi:xylulokinase